MISEAASNKIRTMRVMLLFSIILMGIKFAAYFLTNSNAVLSDALESIINVTAGAFALYSVYFASKPRDADHPYGHGKIENISAGFEGALIFFAGISIIAKAVYDLYYPNNILYLDFGIIISSFAGICNFFMGYFLIKKGKKYDSMLMIADGKHLISDTISSIGLIAGLALMFFTKIYWIDNLLAMLFGGVILKTGYQLIKEALTGLLDEADTEKLNQIIKIFNNSRSTKWIDIHNLRVLKHGTLLHVDCHVTLPWFLSLEEAHKEVKEMEKIIIKNMGDEVEFFIHADPCKPTSCPICNEPNCNQRQKPFLKKLEWDFKNLLPNLSHGLDPLP